MQGMCLFGWNNVPNQIFMTISLDKKFCLLPPKKNLFNVKVEHQVIPCWHFHGSIGAKSLSSLVKKIFSPTFCPKQKHFIFSKIQTLVEFRVHIFRTTLIFILKIRKERFVNLMLRMK